MTVTAYGTTTKVTLEPLFCASCGTAFGIGTQYMADRRDDHRTFYCPNMHSNYYPAQNEAEKLKRELKQSRDYAARLAAEKDQMEHSRRAWKGQATRARNAVLAGTCPICGQTLRDLARHVARVHTGEPAEHPEP